MKNAKILNLILAGLAAVLITSILFSQRESEELRQRTSQLFALDSRSIVISHPGEQNIVLRKKGSLWQLQHNRNSEVWVSASQWKIDQILSALTSVVVREIATTERLADFGLDKPIISLLLGKQRIDFGNTDPIKRYRYIKIDDHIYTCEDTAYRHLIDDYYGFIEKRILPQESRIVKIHTSNLQLSKTPDGRWTSTPAKLISDDVQIRIDAWTTLAAINIRKTTAQTPADKAHIEFEDGNKLDLLLVRRGGSFALVDSRYNFEYEISSPAANQLFNIN